tara:strand:+ start:306 stop:473 length:168 start_codon:yes stop_codon:yes gene_type:complete
MDQDKARAAAESYTTYSRKPVVPQNSAPQTPASVQATAPNTQATTEESTTDTSNS